MALDDIWHFAPEKWNRSYEEDMITILPGSDEYQNVENDLKRAVKNLGSISSISRAQNIFDFGQFLMRGQILCTENPGIQYYEVRRYVEIPSMYKEIAFKHNLDHRRMEMNNALKFQSHLEINKTLFNSSKTIFVVKILTDDPKARCIIPYNFTEYYIDYIVDINV